MLRQSCARPKILPCYHLRPCRSRGGLRQATPNCARSRRPSGFCGGGRVIMLPLAREAHVRACRSNRFHQRRSILLNRTDRPAPMPGEAEVKYLDGDFRIVRPGAFVRCAVTGVPIPLEELRYWSVDLQEAYATPEAVLQRLGSGYARNK